MKVKEFVQCQYAELSNDKTRCIEKATRKYGNCWFCEEHGAMLEKGIVVPIVYEDVISSERKAVGCVLVCVIIIICLTALGIKFIHERIWHEKIEPITTNNVCKVYGHRFANYNFDSRRCIICGKEAE